MATVRVLRSNPDISDTDLTAALVAATDLDAEEAGALVRHIAHHAPTQVASGITNLDLLRKIAAVLEGKGYEVKVDA